MQIGGSSSLQAAEFGGKYRGGFSHGPFEIDRPEFSPTRFSPCFALLPVLIRLGFSYSSHNHCCGVGGVGVLGGVGLFPGAVGLMPLPNAPCVPMGVVLGDCAPSPAPPVPIVC